jgi:hypothetical protein
VVLIGVVVAFVSALVVVRSLGSDSGPTGRAATTTAVEALSGAAAELAELLERRQGATYHARYEGESGQSSSVVIETWQDGGGNVRQDQILRSGDQGAHLMSLVAGGVEVRCTQIATDQWSCRQAAAGELRQADPLAAMRSRLAQGEVTARNVEVDGIRARCFELATDGNRNELCLRVETAVPVRITGGTTELRLVTLEDTVDPSVFTPPAPVQS